MIAQLDQGAEQLLAECRDRLTDCALSPAEPVGGRPSERWRGGRVNRHSTSFPTHSVTEEMGPL